MAISPAVPIVAAGFAYWRGTGSVAWFTIFFVGGYLFFFLLGLPVVALLLKKRRLPACVAAGAAVTLAPLLLLNALSLFASAPAFTLETLLAYVLLAITGGAGGALFWLIAFAGRAEA
jgi:hypothetical protein